MEFFLYLSLHFSFVHMTQSHKLNVDTQKNVFWSTDSVLRDFVFCYLILIYSYFHFFIKKNMSSLVNPAFYIKMFGFNNIIWRSVRYHFHKNAWSANRPCTLSYQIQVLFCFLNTDCEVIQKWVTLFGLYKYVPPTHAYSCLENTLWKGPRNKAIYLVIFFNNSVSTF